jgi:hypothetical protein
MSKFEVIASPDFQNGGVFVLGNIALRHKTETETALFGTETPRTYKYNIANDVQLAELQTEESVRKLSGAAGWGLAGVALAGPVGLLLGALWGGRRRDKVCFAVTMKDGKRFLALADQSVYRQFLAGTFGE